jgi:hypothetical protein
MKLGKLRTLRGTIEVVGGGIGRLNLIAADGLVNYGLKILSFTVWNSQTPSGFSAQQLTGILSLDTITAGDNMNAGDNRQFAWYQSSVSSTLGNIIQPYGVIDPDHIVNRDLFLTMDNTTNGVYNYLIEAQVVELTDDEAIVTIIKETSQS